MGWLIGAAAGILLGFLGGRYLYHRFLAAREAGSAAQREALLQKAREEADRLVKDAQVRAKDEILTRREEFEREAERQRAEIREIELIVTKKEEAFDRRDEELNQRNRRLSERSANHWR